MSFFFFFFTFYVNINRDLVRQRTEIEHMNVIVRTCFCVLFYCFLFLRLLLLSVKEKILLISNVCNQGMRIMNHMSLLVLKFWFLSFSWLDSWETNRKKQGKCGIVCLNNYLPFWFRILVYLPLPFWSPRVFITFFGVNFMLCVFNFIYN